MILRAVGKGQLQQAAGALAVDVDHIVLQPAVDVRFDARQHARVSRWYSAVGQRCGERRCSAWSIESACVMPRRECSSAPQCPRDAWRRARPGVAAAGSALALRCGLRPEGPADAAAAPTARCGIDRRIAAAAHLDDPALARPLPRIGTATALCTSSGRASPRSRASTARRCTCTRGARCSTRWRATSARWPGATHLVCYAMKANSNLAVLQTFARAGCGFDIVSGGELERVLAAGGDAGEGRVLRRRQDARRDAPRARAPACVCFNVESDSELDALSRMVAGQAGKRARDQPARQPRRRRRARTRTSPPA